MSASGLLIYTVASKQHGLGHVKRCLTLARELRQRGVAVAFATEHETPGVDIIREAGFSLYEYHPFDFSWALLSHTFEHVLIDVENGPTRPMLEAVRVMFRKTIVTGGSGYVLRDYEAVLDLSDLRVYQSILPQFDPQGLSGVEYIIIDPVYATLTPDFDGPIVVSLGGSDPHGLTGPVAATMSWMARPVVVINGHASGETIEAREGITVIDNPESLAPYLDGAALLIGALGMTAYEAAAAGVPSLLTAWSDDHVKTTQELEARGVCLNLGRWDAIDFTDLRERAEKLLAYRQGWESMSGEGKALVDGRGVVRVADRVMELIHVDS